MRQRQQETRFAEPVWLELPHSDAHILDEDQLEKLFNSYWERGNLHILLPRGTVCYAVGDTLVYDTPDGHQFQLWPVDSPTGWAWLPPVTA